jgi:phosphatidylglycerophosphate synthase
MSTMAYVIGGLGEYAIRSIVNVAIVPFTILLARSDDAVSTAAALLFAAAAWTDFLDGYLARHANAQTRFGRIADPLADRLLIDLALVLLVYHQRLEWWLAAPVLLRDAHPLAVVGDFVRMAG